MRKIILTTVSGYNKVAPKYQTCLILSAVATAASALENSLRTPGEFFVADLDLNVIIQAICKYKNKHLTLFVAIL